MKYYILKILIGKTNIIFCGMLVKIVKVGQL